jgi:hypothetical protein
MALSSAAPSASLSDKPAVRTGTAEGSEEAKSSEPSGGSTDSKAIAIVGLAVVLLAIGIVFFFFVDVSRRALLPK